MEKIIEAIERMNYDMGAFEVVSHWGAMDINDKPVIVVCVRHAPRPDGENAAVVYIKNGRAYLDGIATVGPRGGVRWNALPSMSFLDIATDVFRGH